MDVRFTHEKVDGDPCQLDSGIRNEPGATNTRHGH
jgi:hypothetical protein